MPWTTVTHARLRAAQGDVAGARRILSRVLGRDAADPDALRLWDDLRGRTDLPLRSPAEAPVPSAPVPFDRRFERERFRRALGSTGGDPRGRAGAIGRLERWLARIENAAGSISVL